MQKKYISYFFIFLFFVVSCNLRDEKIVETESANEVVIFPVTEFIKGQIVNLESGSITPLKITTINGKSDSVWLKTEDIQNFVAPFITPVIDSASMNDYFSKQSFLDRTLNAFTLTYQANEHLPQDILLKHFDVYIDPDDNSVQRVYMVKEALPNGPDSTTQLTWLTKKSCSIVTIVKSSDSSKIVKEEKLIWGFE